jgi:hypothetical protein
LAAIDGPAHPNIFFRTIARTPEKQNNARLAAALVKPPSLVE